MKGKNGKEQVPVNNNLKCKWIKCSNKIHSTSVDKKTQSTIMLFTRDSPQNERSTQAKSDVMKKTYSRQMEMKKIPLSDNIYFKTKPITRHK